MQNKIQHQAQQLSIITIEQQADDDVLSNLILEREREKTTLQTGVCTHLKLLTFFEDKHFKQHGCNAIC